MDLLKERILKDGIALNENVLKVDSFINHQIDSNLMKEIGIEFAKYFKNKNITKVITIESSGIAPALMTALELDVPLVYMKKQTSKILNDDFYQTEVMSFTKGSKYNLTLSKKYINKNDILLIDDFLAHGEAASGMINLVKKANAKIIGIGIVIEKSFQPGRKKLEEMGFDIYSLTRVKSLKDGKITFVE